MSEFTVHWFFQRNFSGISVKVWGRQTAEMGILGEINAKGTFRVKTAEISQVLPFINLFIYCPLS